MMKAVRASESVYFYEFTLRGIPEGSLSSSYSPPRETDISFIFVFNLLAMCPARHMVLLDLTTLEIA
jgi:hypothetical protein